MQTAVVTGRTAFTDDFLARLLEVPDGDRIRTCLQCGACSGVCPFGFVMEAPPAAMIGALRAGQLDWVMETDSAWMCVSCYACAHGCPAQIPLTAGLMRRAKEELLLAGNVPPELQDALENSQRYGNPMGESPRARAAWIEASGLDIPILRTAKRPVEVLWFVGDFGSYHPRVRRATEALAKVLKALDVDFGVLGPDESSDGDSQRMAGERGLFEMLAEKNGRAFSKYEFGEIVTADPHAFNALKNEYPALGIDYPVRHHTQFLAERLAGLAPMLERELAMRVTYHDPCYLGRANDVFDEPRALLRAIPGLELVEMPHCRTTSLCCGGGGGGMWLDGYQWEKAGVRLSDWRMREAMSVGADVLAVACPYEPPRFEDSAKVVDGAQGVAVKEIAELLAESMGL